jgi:hypothetical protein
MAKKSTKEEVKKLTTEELEQLQSLNSTYQNIVGNLGNIEIAKFDLLNELTSVKLKMNEFTSALQGKYGDVTISIFDGTITNPEEAPVATEVPQMQVVRPE